MRRFCFAEAMEAWEAERELEAEGNEEEGEDRIGEPREGEVRGVQVGSGVVVNVVIYVIGTILSIHTYCM